MKKYKEFMQFFLPEKILEYFDIKDVQRVDNVIMITLEEVPWVPIIPEEHRGKKIVSKGFKDILVDDYPVRGKKVKLLIRRRVWKIESIPELLKRDIDIVFPGTRLEKEFASFLKAGD